MDNVLNGLKQTTNKIKWFLKTIMLRKKKNINQFQDVVIHLYGAKNQE